MDSALEKLAEQARSLHPAATSIAGEAAAYATAHGSEGLALYDAKLHTLLRYCSNLCRYAAARATGDAEGEIPAIRNDLVAGWATLDRVRPVEKASRPAVEGLLKRAARLRAASAAKVTGNVGTADGDVADPEKIAARPDPGNLVLDDGEEDASDEKEDEGGDDGVNEEVSGGQEKVYRPPRIAEVMFDGERQLLEEREARVREKMQARAARSRSVREMFAEVSGRPDEVLDDDADGEGFAGREVARMRKEEEERTRYEEENFTRLNVTREDKKRRQRLATVAERSGGGDLVGDAFADLMGVAERVIGKGGKGSAAQRAGQDRVKALDTFDKEFGGSSNSGSGKKRMNGKGSLRKKKGKR